MDRSVSADYRLPIVFEMKTVYGLQTGFKMVVDKTRDRPWPSLRKEFEQSIDNRTEDSRRCDR